MIFKKKPGNIYGSRPFSRFHFPEGEFAEVEVPEVHLPDVTFPEAYFPEVTKPENLITAKNCFEFAFIKLPIFLHYNCVSNIA